MQFIDLLFSRYAQPMALLDRMISGCRLEEFVQEIILTHNKEQQEKTSWEFYIHRVFDKSYSDFMDSIRIESAAPTKADMASVLNNSASVLKDFDPCQQEQ